MMEDILIFNAPLLFWLKTLLWMCFGSVLIISLCRDSDKAAKYDEIMRKKIMAECKNCKNTGWVCEDHQNVAWEDDSCCGGAGMPCIWCNPCDKDNPPRMKEGYEIVVDRDVGYKH